MTLIKHVTDYIPKSIRARLGNVFAHNPSQGITSWAFGIWINSDMFTVPDANYQCPEDQIAWETMGSTSRRSVSSGRFGVPPGGARRSIWSVRGSRARSSKRLAQPCEL